MYILSSSINFLNSFFIKYYVILKFFSGKLVMERKKSVFQLIFLSFHLHFFAFRPLTDQFPGTWQQRQRDMCIGMTVGYNENNTRRLSQKKNHKLRWGRNLLIKTCKLQELRQKNKSKSSVDKKPDSRKKTFVLHVEQFNRVYFFVLI